MSEQQFENFTASSLYCAKCKAAMPVRERLLLILPDKEIFDVIQYFGSRKKIFNVHFRNIRGKRDDFVEVYPDEGDINLVNALLAYREVDYPYMIMPDHVPYHPDDPGGSQAFAFAYGYIRALIQSADLLG